MSTNFFAGNMYLNMARHSNSVRPNTEERPLQWSGAEWQARDLSV